MTKVVVLEKFKKGDNIEAKILDIDLEKERISLGIKQLTSNPAADAAERLKKVMLLRVLSQL